MANDSLRSLSSLYITSCGIEGKSPETLRSYAETLKLFMRAVERLGLPNNPGLFRPADVYEFLGHVGSTGVSAITQWRRQRETRAFFSWLLRHDYISSNPFMKVKNIKVPQKIVQPFTADVIQRLLSYCAAGTRKGARNQALILVLLDTGLRASELANLELADVDFTAQRILIKHAKGNKQRVVRFGERARQAMQHYIRSFRGDAPGYLLLTARGRRHLNRSAMRTIFQRLGEECGIAKVHPHRFRHTFATWAIEQQAREIDVQRLLGHSTSAMPRRYTASYDAEKAAQAHASFSPGDRLGAAPVSVPEFCLAPNVSTASANDCLHAGAQTSRTCREVVFPNGIINAWDSHMPAALAMFMLHDDGFLRPADKDSIYSSGNLFYTTHIPAEPWIAPINNDLSGYQWNSWGGPGAKAGQYEFWTSLADSSAEVLSCAGPSSGAYYVPAGGSDPCGDGSGVRTGGYSWTKVYTDNHGEAMTWVNGDANLGFSECDSSAGGTDPDHMIVLLSGYYCENGDKVGHSTIRASVDYPDKRKHFAIMSNEVDIDWTWGGIKEVTIEPGENAQFNYVVFHVTDRDGYCGNSPSLHPVLGKRVNFVIDSPNGIIFPNADGHPAALLGTWGGRLAATYTFDTADSALTITPTLSDDECQAWIHITESLLQPVNVLVIAYDPEGTVTFDKIVNAPTPTPEPPSPTPANQQNLWADIDCDNNVNPVDSLKILRADAGLSVSQSANCPTPGGDLNVQWGGLSTNEKWADADCSGGLDPADSLKILRSDAGLFYIQQEPCPDIGAEVLIPQQ